MHTKIKASLITVLVLLLFKTSMAQSIKLHEFIPTGYTLLDSARGDLNQDGYTDFIVILRNKLDTIATDTARPLLIIHGQKNGTYALAGRNDSIVLCLSCGGVYGDPYSKIAIKKNYFSIEFYGGSNWRWSRIITFKYNLLTSEYILHKDAGEAYNMFDQKNTEYQVFNKELWDKALFKTYVSE